MLYFNLGKDAMKELKAIAQKRSDLLHHYLGG